jgi:hypothetical protein
MTEPQSNQQPYQGIPGSGGQYPQQGQAPYPQAVQDQAPYGAQNPYGQQQPQYGGANPYAQQQQAPYGQPPQGPQNPQNPYAQPGQNPYGTPGPAPKRRRGATLLYVRLGVLVVVLIIGGVSWLITEHKKAGRDANGDINKQGNLDAFSIKVNDCYEKPTDASAGFSSVKAIPCDQPHNAQVFFQFTFPNATSVAPTDEELKSTADPQCTTAAGTKVDQNKAPQNAMMNYLVPDNTAWGKGHHDILCVIENDTDFTGTVVKS